jgi:hypothetical protein
LFGSYELADCRDEFVDAFVGLPEALVDYTVAFSLCAVAFSLVCLVAYEILFNVGQATCDDRDLLPSLAPQGAILLAFLAEGFVESGEVVLEAMKTLFRRHFFFFYCT